MSGAIPSMLDQAAETRDGARPARVGRPLAWLLAAHVVALLAAVGACIALKPPVAGWAIPYLPLNLVMVLVGAQACLIAFWGAFADAPRSLRLAIPLVGALVLMGLLYASHSTEPELSLIGPISLALFGATALAFRWRSGTRLLAGPAGPPGTEREGLRFSIRGLMLLTLAVALAIGAARGLHDLTSGRVSQTVLMPLICVAIVAPALAAAWAALGLAPILARSVAALVLALSLAALLAYGFRVNELPTIVNVLTALAGPTPIVLLSLLVLRATGSRLVAPISSGMSDKEMSEIG